jgi:hypothetical protein
MRTLLTEVQQIENHLLHRNEPGDALVFEARLLLDKDLSGKAMLQSKAYAFINFHGRRQLKRELEAVHQQLFTSPKHQGFRERILKLFGTK